MSIYYGVNCDECDTFLEIGEQHLGEDDKKIVFLAAPLDEIKCPVCEHQQQYGGEHLVDEHGVRLSHRVEELE
jgi:hypothetical protein